MPTLQISHKLLIDVTEKFYYTLDYVKRCCFLCNFFFLSVCVPKIEGNMEWCLWQDEFAPPGSDIFC